MVTQTKLIGGFSAQQATALTVRPVFSVWPGIDVHQTRRTWAPSVEITVTQMKRKFSAFVGQAALPTRLTWAHSVEIPVMVTHRMTSPVSVGASVVGILTLGLCAANTAAKDFTKSRDAAGVILEHTRASL